MLFSSCETHQPPSPRNRVRPSSKAIFITTRLLLLQQQQRHVTSTARPTINLATVTYVFGHHFIRFVHNETPHYTKLHHGNTTQVFSLRNTTTTCTRSTIKGPLSCKTQFTTIRNSHANNLTLSHQIASRDKNKFTGNQFPLKSLRAMSSSSPPQPSEDERQHVHCRRRHNLPKARGKRVTIIAFLKPIASHPLKPTTMLPNTTTHPFSITTCFKSNTMYPSYAFRFRYSRFVFALRFRKLGYEGERVLFKGERVLFQREIISFQRKKVLVQKERKRSRSEERVFVQFTEHVAILDKGNLIFEKSCSPLSKFPALPFLYIHFILFCFLIYYFIILIGFFSEWAMGFCFLICTPYMLHIPPCDNLFFLSHSLLFILSLV